MYTGDYIFYHKKPQRVMKKPDEKLQNLLMLMKKRLSLRQVQLRQ